MSSKFVRTKCSQDLVVVARCYELLANSMLRSMGSKLSVWRIFCGVLLSNAVGKVYPEILQQRLLQQNLHSFSKVSCTSILQNGIVLVEFRLIAYASILPVCLGFSRLWVATRVLVILRQWHFRFWVNLWFWGLDGRSNWIYRWLFCQGTPR